MRLVPVSLDPPPGLEEVLRQLGLGENGFVGTGQPVDTSTLSSYLRGPVDMADGVNLKPGWVPTTTYWLLDDAGDVAGLSRLRHRPHRRRSKTAGTSATTSEGQSEVRATALLSCALSWLRRAS